METINNDLVIKFKTLLSVFKLEKNTKIESALEVLNNSKSNKAEKTAAKEVIIKVISKRMLKSDILKAGLTLEQYQLVKEKLSAKPNLERNDRFVSALSALYKIYLNAAREYAFVETSLAVEKILKGQVNATIDRLIEENWELYEGNNTNFERLFEIVSLLHSDLGLEIVKSKKKGALEQYNDIDEEYKHVRQAIREDLNVVPIDACNELVRYIEMEADFYATIKNKKKTSTKKKETSKDKLVAILKKPFNKKKTKKEKKKMTERTKKIIAGLTAAGILVGAFFIGRSSKKNNASSNNNQGSISDNIIPEDNNQNVIPPVEDNPVIVPPVEDIPVVDNTEKELLQRVNVLADSVYNSWKNVPGNEYTKENVVELVKCLNGLDSNIDLATADDMIVEMLNKVTVPAVNNMMLNTNAFPVSTVELSDLLLTDVQAIDDMESYFNGALMNPLNRQTYTNYLNNALVDEHIILDGKTYKGFNLDTAKPEVRLLWSRLAIGTNAMLGTLGEEHVVVVNGVVYTAKEVDDYRIYNSIASEALKELGLNSKTLVK